MKKLIYSLAIFLVLLSSFIQAEDGREKALQAVASLLYHVNEEIHSSTIDDEVPELTFEPQEIENLWTLAYPLTGFQEDYRLWQVDRSDREALERCGNHLRTLWHSYLNRTPESKSSIFAHDYAVGSLQTNSLLNKKILKEITPHLLSPQAPITPIVDQIFTSSRPTFNEDTLVQAGFSILHHQPRSYILVAKHHALPGMLFKIYLDTELRLKENVPGWKWFVRRCEGANSIKKVITAKKIKHFIVPAKYIYILPPETIPDSMQGIDPKLAVLIVEDMQLVDKPLNYAAWKNLVTPEILNELYLIISRANGSSYRPDNIPYTKSGRFAFIDTEYPQRNPDFKSIRSYLSSNMRSYWDQLVKKGGPE